MKIITSILIILIVGLGACDQAKDSNEKELQIIEVGSFNYALGTYKISFRNRNYLILRNENDFYYLLEDIGKVKGKLDYFNRRKDILESPVELDSTLFFNLKDEIIFIDSCNKELVNGWVKKIESNPESLHQPIKVDSTISRVDLNNIYYGLIKDSFKIHVEDSYGRYILSR